MSSGSAPPPRSSAGSPVLFAVDRGSRAGHHAWHGHARIARLIHERSAISPLAEPVGAVAVIGAGTMGTDIAASLLPLVPVHLVDVRADALERARADIALRVRRNARTHRLAACDATRALARLTCAHSLDGARAIDFVIEAVPEDVALKRTIHRDARAALGPRPVFASNTSALTVRSIAEPLGDTRALGMHFCHPADAPGILEVSVNRNTDPAASATASALGVLTRKSVVVVRDSVGLLTTRILSAWLGEALALLDEGVPFDGIDRAARRAGFTAGPFALLDRIGIQTAARVSAFLAAALAGPATGAQILARMVDAGHTGVRAGRGFYQYGPDGRRVRVSASPHDRARDASIVERLVLAIVNESARALQKRVAAFADDIDLAVVLGLGFPARTGGPLHWLEQNDAAALAARMRELAIVHGPRFAPCALIDDVARGGRLPRPTRTFQEVPCNPW